MREAALKGREAAAGAADAVVATWERLRGELGARAEELLKLFQEQLWRLACGAMASAVRYLPASLEGDWDNDLDTVSAKLCWSVSPSVRTAVDGWLAIAVGGGFDLSVTYKRRDPSAPKDSR